ncbi:WAS/WASL-interacting protein family member 3-like [Ornithodoros turicata]|uniref:WH2 domain-containing protein n=1 Tax=Ornithodoros turicata TaxID=34597 RepID=A0A2R5LLC1_9ACAR
MPPPPPPPPPMGGPPLSKPVAPVPSADRSALLSEIRGGATLKKTATNDRSAPVIGSKKGKTVTDAAPTRMNGPPGLGGLFAGGVPKLRPVGSSGGGPAQHSAPRPVLPTGNDPSPSAAPPRHRSETPPARRALPPFPADVAPRGPPPAPPPSNQKPNFSASTSPVQNRVRAGPPLPNKPPGVTRSASQTSLNAKRPPLRAPTVKPPPPPKSPVVATTVGGGNMKFGTLGPQPRLCVPTTGVGRRQSFGAVDTREREHENSATVPAKMSGPPPPPRNISVPGNLNQVHKARTAPPPPPAPPARPPAARPPPPPRGQPPPLPSTGPPQLPQRNSQAPPPPPPNQASKPVGLVPPGRPSPTPPQRSSSMRNSDVPQSFEGRFTFNPVSCFPAPCYVATDPKKYPSKGPKRNHQRQAPPPPVPGLAAQAV